MATGFRLLDQPNPNFKQYTFPRRNGRKVTGGIILHDAEGGTDLTGEDTGAERVAQYICTRTSPGSYHVLTDRDSIIPMAPFDYETWHDTTSNNYTVGISVAWNKADLPRMTAAQRESFYIPFAKAVLATVEWFATTKGITVPIGRFLSRDEIVAGKPGLSTHSRMDPTRRSDPFGTGSVYEAEFLAVLARLAAPFHPAVSTTLIQTRLTDLGYYTGLIDGDYGPLTRAAVATYQQANGLHPDGEWGPLTEAHYQEENTMPSVSEIVTAVWGATLGRGDNARPIATVIGHTEAKVDAVYEAVKAIPGVDADKLAADVAARLAEGVDVNISAVRREV